nr:thioredoxin family protein [Desulfurispirillum indicum]
MNAIIGMGIMIAPGIAIDGELKSTGKLLCTEEIKKLLT